ncbi:MAG: acetolactate synthase small subunit [Ktedonobacteraceae bacterium]|nr:acetolactate synthase small subunit [Ktedonobacteraceae bacterium]MBO0792375.1 acetolactate synthase small subunit [Ktedonobacteraceae bacterium]
MTTDTAPTYRPGQSDLPPEKASAHTLIILVEERPGTIDRVVGVLRRRRANMQTLVLGHSEAPNVVRITVVVNDSEVGVDQLVEQLRKIVDVRQVVCATAEQSVTRELALIKVSSTPESLRKIIELGQLSGAHAIDIADGSVTLEVSGNEDKVDSLIEQLQPFSIREVARSGRITMQRDTSTKDAR